ncbi:hypothetical protein PR202_ga29221 [Eleusine coracana subsp. coracana]|uniref:Phorbol-ester/DAG-type domain-containing protein n=1 Tax=Eleusine coracana subsp. coracana TaxID=191504 RepID=A0AAV5DKL0_ELECO|nr:hypothetical protein QOZ80_7AG0576710 [Eleusine coracana subsp. coracana]GJN11058.1 hypothetical protein PR202_ga29221 [Eleusine coracana subsp. coracana]
MAPATASATIKSSFFHPQHLLTWYHYSEASTYSCDACERIVIGPGYSCDECNFDIHEACLLTLPGSISFDEHKKHELTLTRLGASRWCDLCKETSHAGSHMYRCVECNFDVHPRCTSLLADDGARPRRHGRTRRTVKVGLKIGMFGFKVANVVTGGIFSPVLDVVDLAIDNM